MNEKAKKVLRVYEIFSVCLISLLILTALIVWINFGRITVFAIGKALDNYDTEITELISDYLAASGDSMEIKSIQMTRQEGVQALRFDFMFASRDLQNIGIDTFHNKSSQEIVRELGITPDEIPSEVKSLVQSTRLAVEICIYNEDDNLVFKRLIMPNEIAEFLR